MLSEVSQGHTQDQLSDHDTRGFVEVAVGAAGAVYWQSTSDMTKHYVAPLNGQLEDSTYNAD